MKRLLLFAGFILTFSPLLFSQNFYINEDFNSGVPSSWTNNAVSGSFNWMEGSIEVPSGPSGVSIGNIDGTGMVYFNDDSLGNNHKNNTVELISPVINPSSGFPLTLEFDYNFRAFTSAPDSLIVKVFNGTSWVRVFHTTTDNCGRWTCTPPHANVDLTSYINNKLQVKFIYTDGNDWSFWAAFDNVEVWAPYAIDVSAQAIVNPISNCGLSSTSNVVVSVKNVGFSDVVNFPISYKIDNNTTVTETVTDTVKVGSTYEFTFSQTADLSTMKKYAFTVYTALSSDMDLGNDTIQDSIEHITPILPDYAESFENEVFGWLIYGANSSIEYGVPASANINTAPDGKKIAGTNLTGAYNDNEMSYLETPCFDFSTATGAPFLNFYLNYRTRPGEDYFWFEESYDGGATWSKVQASMNSNNWYKNTGVAAWDSLSSGWILVENVLPNAIGEGSAKFRFAFKSDPSSSLEGFGLDNFLIYNPKPYDVKMVDILTPKFNKSSCGYRNAQDVIVRIFNQGSNTITSGTLNYRINSGPGSDTTIYRDSRTLSIAPNTPFTFVHKTPIDLGVSGTYDIDVWFDVPNEGYRLNDSIVGYKITHQAVDSLFVNFTTFPGNASTGWTFTSQNGYFWKEEDRTTGGDSGPELDHTGDFNGNGKYLFTYVPLNCPDGSVATFTSPCLNFGMTNGAVVSFWYHKYGNAMGNLFVDVYDPVTESWIVATTILGQTHRAKSAKWLEETIRVTTDYSSKIRFRGVSKGFTNGNMAIDDIEIYPPDPIDGKLKAVLEPNTDCNLSLNEKFVIQIANFGLNEIDTVPICYTFDTLVPNQPDTREIICDTAFAVGILPGAILTYTFPDFIDLSTYDSAYTIDVWIDVPGDKRPKGDTVHYIVINETQHFPYCENFDTAYTDATGKFWERGYFNTLYTSQPPDDNLYSWRPASSRPSSATGPSVDHTSTVDPSSPSKFMYIEAKNGKNVPPPSVGTLISPCFDLTNTPSANLEFWYHMFGSGIGQLHIDIQTSTGIEYDVFVLDSAQQFSKGADWKLKTLSLSEYTGDFVTVRFRAVWGKNANGEIALDDICVVVPEPQQLAVDTIVTPGMGRCNYWTDEAVTVRVRNVGRDDLDSLVVCYAFDPSWDGNNNNFNPGPEVCEVFHPGLPLQPGAITEVKFVTTANMRPYEKYRFRAIARQPGDVDPEDDSAFINVIHPVPVNLPYEEDFESMEDEAYVFSNGWVENGNVDFFWRTKDGPDRLGLTGPAFDHTIGDSYGNYLYTQEIPPPLGNPIPGDLAIVSTPCVALPDNKAPSIEFWYHKFGWQMGNMYLEIFDDTNWVRVGDVLSQTQLNNFDPWKKFKAPLPKWDHQNAKFRWKGAYGGAASHMAIDDLYIGEMPQFDIAVNKVISPNGNKFECYSMNSVVKVEIENTGLQDWDFTRDSLTLFTEVSLNGIVVQWDTTHVVTNPGNQPLEPEETLIVDIYPIDLSQYDELYKIKITSHSSADTANYENNVTTHEITPTINAGEIFALTPDSVRVELTDICYGSSVLLVAEDFHGQLTWQEYETIPGVGSFWMNVRGQNQKERLITFPDTTTYYRIQICDVNTSDSVLYSNEEFGGYDSVMVNVTKVPVPTPVNDTVCAEGTIVLAPQVDGAVQKIHWYENKLDEDSFYTGMVYSDFFTDTEDFFLESEIDGCRSLDRAEIKALVPDYPVVDLGNDTTICPDSIYYLNAGGGAGYKYVWKREGDPTPGANDSINNSVQTLGVNAFLINKYSSTDTTIITFSTSVTSPYLCETRDTVRITVLRNSSGVCAVGIDEEQQSDLLEVYPNPSNGKLNIYLNMENSSEATLEMYSVDGKTVIEKEQIVPKNFNRHLDLSAYPNGVYFIKVTSNEVSTVERVVLTK